MTHFSDDLYLGNAKLTPNDPNPSGGSQPQLGGLGLGPLGRVYLWDAGTPAAASTTNIVTAAAIGSSLAAVLTAGTGTSFVTNFRGERVLQLDVPRAVQVTASGNEAARVVTVLGYDRYGQKMSEAFSGLNANTVQGKKAFYQILSVTESQASVGNISVGVNDVLGLPVRCDGVNYILARESGIAFQTIPTPTAFVAADVTNPATTTTGDVRGTYDPQTAMNGSVRVTGFLFVTAAQAGPNATRLAAYGVDQNLGSQ